MKAIEINGEIKLFHRTPKNWSNENGTHFNIGDGSDYGFKNVATPEYDERIEELVNLHLDGDFYTYDVIDKPIKETLAVLKKAKIAELKNIASNKLFQTDWYIIRNSDSGEEVPQEIKDSRADIRSKSDTIEAEINALNSKKEVILFNVNI